MEKENPPIYASLWRRFIAFFIIDGIVLSIASLIISGMLFYGVAYYNHLAYDVGFSFNPPIDLKLFLLNIILKFLQVIGFFSYFVIMEAKFGATLGKKALSIKIISPNKKYPSRLQSLIRYIPFGFIVIMVNIIPIHPILIQIYAPIKQPVALLLLAFIIISGLTIIFGKYKQSLSDMLAKTVVIKV